MDVTDFSYKLNNLFQAKFGTFFDAVLRTNTRGIYRQFMMTSSNSNIFRVTGPLGKESAGYRWIPLKGNNITQCCPNSKTHACVTRPQQDHITWTSDNQGLRWPNLRLQVIMRSCKAAKISISRVKMLQTFVSEVYCSASSFTIECPTQAWKLDGKGWFIIYREKRPANLWSALNILIMVASHERHGVTWSSTVCPAGYLS